MVFFQPLIDGGVKLIESSPERRSGRGFVGEDLGKTRTQKTTVASATKQDRTPTFVRDSITMRFRYARN